MHRLSCFCYVPFFYPAMLESMNNRTCTKTWLSFSFPSLSLHQAVRRNELPSARWGGGRHQNDSLWISHMVTTPPLHALSHFSSRCNGCLFSPTPVPMRRYSSRVDERRGGREGDFELWTLSHPPNHTPTTTLFGGIDCGIAPLSSSVGSAWTNVPKLPVLWRTGLFLWNSSLVWSVYILEVVNVQASRCSKSTTRGRNIIFCFKLKCQPLNCCSCPAFNWLN